MNSGLYAACAGLVARMQSVDSIAANVANSSSTGFRGQKSSFGTLLATHTQGERLSALNQSTNTFSSLGSMHLDTTQGTLEHTGNDLDVALQGTGYFKLQTQHGVQYTRNGSFRVDANGMLTNSAGDQVLGENGPITMGSGPVVVSANGTVSCGGTAVGKLAVVDFGPAVSLQHLGQGNYGAPAGAEVPASQFAVQQGSLESSNVSPVQGVVDLISAQRAAESMRHVLSMLDTDMNKTAAVDLSRVA